MYVKRVPRSTGRRQRHRRRSWFWSSTARRTRTAAAQVSVRLWSTADETWSSECCCCRTCRERERERRRASERQRGRYLTGAQQRRSSSIRLLCYIAFSARLERNSFENEEKHGDRQRWKLDGVKIELMITVWEDISRSLATFHIERNLVRAYIMKRRMKTVYASRWN